MVRRTIELVGATPAGSTCLVPLDSPDDVGVVASWCEATGNAVLAVHADAVEVHRGRISDPIAALSADRRPGHRLWVYTNFHCNLACDYCCVASSPKADRRVIPIAEFADLIDAAADADVRELFLTGGEPFLLLDLDERLALATARFPTTVLTNAMVWTGERRRRLEAMPREGLTLQISIDSADPDLHDLHRGEGSHQRAVAGIHLALELGFQVRLAATLGTDAAGEHDKLIALFDELGLRDDQRVVRRIARQGVANAGLVVSRASLLPEVCVSSEGVWWHPVGAIDPAMHVRDNWRPLQATIDEITNELRMHRLRGDVLASTFPCA